MDRITLSSMRAECRIGASEEERAFPQMLEVDLIIEADLSSAAASDDLAGTIDYGPLVELIERTLEGGTFHTLEGLAGVLVRSALEAAPTAAAVTVRVRKLAVPMDVWLDHAEVELRRGR
ncbi:MAG: dihydroneopterin aldolase [Candidatus Limnocylindrales bacterium]